MLGIHFCKDIRKAHAVVIVTVMTPNQYLWAQARDRLVIAVTGIGFSAELAELMARQLGSPKAIDQW